MPSTPTIFHNGRIHLDPHSPDTVNSLLIQNSHVQAYGFAEDVAAKAVSGALPIDLGGKTVVPGLVDAHIHLAIDKSRLDGAANGNGHQIINCRIPYLIRFDYLTTLANQHIKDRLGHTARGMIILDEKEQFDDDIRRITRFRRFHVPRTRRLKWLVEFSYSIDSRRHPMVQLSDLVIYKRQEIL